MNIFGVFGVLISLALLCAVFRDLGYKAGRRDGYAAGREDAALRIAASMSCKESQ